MKKATCIGLLSAIILMFLTGCINIWDRTSAITNIEPTEQQSYESSETTEVGDYSESKAVTAICEETEPHENAETESKNEECNVPVLNFKTYGEYHKAGFGSMYDQYSFDAPNDKWTVWGIGEESIMYMVACQETGRSFSNVTVRCDNKFIALSSKYMLFETEEGQQIAIDVVDMSNKIPIDELTEDERNDFVYPIKYQRVINVEDSFVKATLGDVVEV